jgi:hypothetical protein
MMMKMRATVSENADFIDVDIGRHETCLKVEEAETLAEKLACAVLKARKIKRAEEVEGELK